MKTTKLRSAEKGRPRGTPGPLPSLALPPRVARQTHDGPAAGAGPGLPLAAATLCPSLRDQWLLVSYEASESAEAGSFKHMGSFPCPVRPP